MQNAISADEKKEFLAVFSPGITREGINEICKTLGVSVKQVLPGRVTYHRLEVIDGGLVSEKIVECAKFIHEILSAEPNFSHQAHLRKR